MPKRSGKGRRPTYRSPSYGAATRLARIVYELTRRPTGLSQEAMTERLGISQRTLYRYLGTLRRQFIDEQGRPLFEEHDYGDRRVLRVAREAEPVEATPYQAASFYFALELFKFLEGTVLKQGLDDLWDRFTRGLPPRYRWLNAADFGRRFFSIPFAPKSYEDADETLDVLLRCLIGCHRLRIDYAGLHDEHHEHVFDPYTLAMYRGGLYLIGRSQRARKVIILAVERIAAAEKLDETFDYPENYSPARYTQGTFGIISGPETAVELLITNAETVKYLSSRLLHPTQEFRRRRDGKTVLHMRVRGTAELRTWILGMSPWVLVLKPKALRDEVREMLRSATRLYA